MDCPNCHTWNPDDKTVCWRCQTALPKPVEKRPKRPSLFLGLPGWAWIIVVAMLVFTLVTSFLGPQIAGH